VSAPSATPLPDRTTDTTPRLSWEQISWATRYQVQIHTSTSWGTPRFNNDRLTTTAFDAPRLTAGRWFWRVRALRPDGSWGAWSSAASFVIAG
jgi:hypothetical protein